MAGGPAVLATGSALPSQVRRNDDPVYAWLRAHQPAGHDLFTGYDERRVLAPDETLVDLMAAAATSALGAAGVAATDVDLVLGYASMSTWLMPNDLVATAQLLGVPPTAMVVPINGEYAIFNQALATADALIGAGRAGTALVVVGADWSRRVDYHSSAAVSAGDGAGAAVVGHSEDPGLWRVVDLAVDGDPTCLGGMYLAADPTTPAIVPATYGPAYFHLGESGVRGFQGFGVHGPPAMAVAMADRHDLDLAEVTLIGHQASGVLLDAWREAVAPATVLDTLARFGNLTSASIPVTLDVCAAELTTPHLVLAGLGPEPSCTMLLLSREPAARSGPG